MRRAPATVRVVFHPLSADKSVRAPLMPYRHALALELIRKPGASATGLCALHVPQAEDFLGVHPFSAGEWRLPAGVFSLRFDLSLGLFGELEYGPGGVLEQFVPRGALPMLGASAGEDGMKWGVRRSWGAASRPAADQMVLLDDFLPGAILDRLRVGAWVSREGEWLAAPAPARAASVYRLFDAPTLESLVFMVNHQADHGPFESVAPRVAQAQEPMHGLVSLGALPLEWPEIRSGDTVWAAAWDGEADMLDLLDSGAWRESERMSVMKVSVS